MSNGDSNCKKDVDKLEHAVVETYKVSVFTEFQSLWNFMA